MARSILSDSVLGQEFAGEALLHAAFIHNHVLRRGKEATPYELCFPGGKSDVGLLRPFGCPGYAKVRSGPKANAGWRERAFSCYFLNVVPDLSAVRVVCKTTRRVYVVRTAVFGYNLMTKDITWESVDGTPVDIFVDDPNDGEISFREEVDLVEDASGVLKVLINASAEDRYGCVEGDDLRSRSMVPILEGPAVDGSAPVHRRGDTSGIPNSSSPDDADVSGAVRSHGGGSVHPA